MPLLKKKKKENNPPLPDLNVKPGEIPLSQQPIDPRIPLTQGERFTLQKTWKAMSRKGLEAMTLTFFKLFSRNPQYATQYFAKYLSGVAVTDEDAFRSCEAFTPHLEAVAEALDTCVNSLTDPDEFLAHVKQLSDMHAKVHALNKPAFKEFEECFLEVCEYILEDRYNDKVRGIYHKFWPYTFQMIL